MLSGLLALDLALFLQLEGLESLDLHHKIKALLLLDPLLLKTLSLLELAIANSHDLGVKHHLVHVLDIVVILVQDLLSLSQQAIGLFLVNDLLLRQRHLVCAFFV